MATTIRLLLLALVLAGCGAEPTLSSYEMTILQHRFEKDMQMKDEKRTILRPQELARFRALRYFDVDSTLRFELPLVRVDEPESVIVYRKLGNTDRFTHIGFVDIPIDGDRHRLMVFRPEASSPNAVWIPFADATSGKDTFGGGRYLDARVDGDRVMIDFNQAHNPICDYNPEFNCVMAPAANRLPVPVTAGEMRSLLLD